MPLPPETPVDTTPTASNASGLVTVSGGPPVSGDASGDGPYRIERQSLTINYHRVPMGAGSFNASCVSLSGVSQDVPDISYRHYQTYLVAEVKATYSVEKEYAWYNATGFQQPQKFKYLALSADDNGVVYGSHGEWHSATAAGGCLGPQGTIVTDKEWYQRKPWVDGLHTEVVSAIDCRTYYASAGTVEWNGSAIPRMVDATRYAGDQWRFLISPGDPLGFNSRGSYGGDLHMMGGMDYQMAGAYNYTKEDAREIINFIEWISKALRFKYHYDIVAEYIPLLSYFKGVGIAEYRSSRHDYD